LVHTTINGAPFIIKTETHSGVEHLQSVSEFYVHSDNVYVFEANSGAAITKSGGRKS